MKLEALTDRVQFWADQLGVYPWRVEVEIADDNSPHGNSDAKASVDVSKFYNSAWMSFSRECLPQDDAVPERLDETIVHELLHILDRDYDEAITSVVEHHVAPTAIPFVVDSLKLRKEWLIEHLARAIVGIYHEANAPKPEVVHSSE